MDRAIKRFFIYQFPVILWGMLIFVISSLPGVSQPFTKIPYLDKVAHFFEYGVFAFLMSRAFYFSESKPRIIRALVLSFIFCALFGALDEIHQLFIPGREQSVKDFFADIAGILAALTVFFIRYRSFSGTPSR
jgi:VanZ family protein